MVMMMKRNKGILMDILRFPNKRLNIKATPLDIAEINDDLRILAQNMLTTMYDSGGVGLAATQVDFHKRLVVVDVSNSGDDPRIFINPTITNKLGGITTREYCLSLPGIAVDVKRSYTISVEYLDEYGEERELEDISGLFAICMQHEIEHLDGITIYDHLSQLKKDRLTKRMEKRRWTN